jgi:hypothetical protein
MDLVTEYATGGLVFCWSGRDPRNASRAQPLSSAATPAERLRSPCSALHRPQKYTRVRFLPRRAERLFPTPPNAVY